MGAQDDGGNASFKRLATASGRGLLWLARHMLALLAATASFIVLRAIPAGWRWLRDTAFPALQRFYRWLPHRRKVVAGAAGAAAIAIALLLWRMPGEARHAGSSALANNAAGTSAAIAVTVDGNGVVPLPRGPWTRLARQLVEAKDLASATRVTREVLARGGMATTDGERILVKAIGPATPYALTALEARNLAMEARHRQTAFRLHASEFAHFLDTFVWDLGGSGKDKPAWLTEEEARAYYDEAAAKADTAEDAVRAGAHAEDSAAQQQIAQLEAAAAEALARLQDAKAAINTVPLAEREPLYARLKEARQASMAAHGELNRVRRAAEDATGDRTRRANRARRDAHREFWAWQQVGPNYRSGGKLLELLDTWVREAAKHPDDPESFTPLFLAEMARLQQAPFDLLGSEYMRPSRGAGTQVDLRGGPRADDYQLTLLEMQMFLAAFQRGQPALPTAARSSLPARLASNVIDVVLPPAHAQDSLAKCAGVKKILGGDSAREADAVGWAVNEAGNAAFKALGSLYGLSGDMLSGLGNASKILRVVIQYANTEAKVRAEQGMVHKPPSGGGEGHGSRFAWFTASAGVDPKDLEDYERSLQDEEARTGEILNQCFGALELPSLQSLREIADAAEGWRVQWEIRPLHPEHLNIPMRDPDNDFVKRNSVQREMQLKRASPAHAEARLKAQVAPEQASRGEVATAHATVIAKVVDTGAPGFGEMVNAVKGIFGLGLTDVVVDMAAGWMKHILVPRAAAVQSIEYHCLQVERREVPDGEVRAWGNGTDIARERDNCVVPAATE